MTIEIKGNAQEKNIEIAGRLDATTSPVLEKAILENIGDAKKLVLDLKGLEYISSAGLRVLLGAQKKMQKLGGMRVTNVGKGIMEIFEITGFVDVLTIE